jgi:PAS domain S-box-containing protein
MRELCGEASESGGVPQKQAEPMRRKRWQPIGWNPVWTVLVLFACCFLFEPLGEAQLKDVRRVLILTEFGLESPGVAAVKEELVTVLENSPYQIEFYSENLDTTFFPAETSQDLFREEFIRKYRGRKLDAIVVLGPSPIKFMAALHEKYFPRIPIVFGGSPAVSTAGANLDSHFTGVWAAAQPEKTLETALRLQPGTEHVVVVGGVAPYDRYLEALAKERFRSYESKFDFTYLTDLDMASLLEKLKHLPGHTIVYYTSIMQDAKGSHFIDETQSVPLVAGASTAAVFVADDVDLGRGTVGGNVFSFAAHGRDVAGIVVRILNGEKPQDIPVVQGANILLFDWRALRRWGLKESELPVGAIVLNRDPTFWEQYKRYLTAGVLLLLAQALIILGLLWQRMKRRRVEAALVRSNDRLRLAMESGKSVGWEWDLASGRDFWFGDLSVMFGISSDSYSGQIGDFYRYVHPEDRQRISNAVTVARQNRTPYAEEFRIVRQDGNARCVVSRGKFEYAQNGKARRMVGLAVDITERKQIEDALKRSELRSREQVLQSPVSMIVTRGPRREYEVVNLKFTEVFGYSIEDMPDEAHWWALAYPDDSYRETVKAEWQARVGKTVGSHITSEPLEATVRCKDGSSRYVEFHFTSLGDTGLVSFVDLTDRQRAEEALRESEERFRLVANAAPVMIWMAGPDKLCTYFNQPWLTFTGRSILEELGNRWTEGVHAEDLEQCMDTYAKAVDKRESFEREYRLRRHDGEYRWVLDLGVPRFNADGSFAGYIGSCLDVTERKLAEEALSSVSRRLIEAHEEERAWIARELHDDINQRLALLAVKMEGLGQALPASAAGLRNRLREEIKHVSEIGSEIQGLSHRLHSSKLEYLGLAAAAASFCRELSGQQKVEVDFRSDDVPKDLSQDISLCLFRVLQEALQNAAKHSGSKRFQVMLSSTSNDIQLTVQDSGVGFDVEEALKGHGLGLTSMKERLKLVDGDLSIDARVQVGTTIRARVSCNRHSKSARVAS